MTNNFFLKNNNYISLEYLQDNCYIYVGCGVHVNHSKECPSPRLLKLLESGKYADVTFVVEGRKFRAHRVIVASQSAYFDW